MNKTKILTMYLPQFHQTKENDEWWGEGFTEWTVVKAAKPIFEGHIQPKVPLNENYYDLMDRSTMEQQAHLMKQYGVDGQCFYHYFFEDGKMVLQKPAENLLKWKDIDMPFCFCWANGTWARTWSNVKGNAWADVFEKKKGKNDSGILLLQRYGREKLWKQHLEYLVQFFKDERYIKYKGQPVFLIYGPAIIPCLYPMIDYWQTVIKEYGFEKIYIIGENISEKMEGLDAILLHAPHQFWDYDNAEATNGVVRPDYDLTWENILNCKGIPGIKTYFEGVVNFDDTPRRGSLSGVCAKNFSIEAWERNFKDLLRKSIEYNNEFVFINAWNEWGEGMYLEPDEINQYSLLNAIKIAREEIAKEKIDSNLEFEQNNESVPVKRDKTAYYLNMWLNCLESNHSIVDYFIKNDIRNIVVYGYGYLGRHLVKQLENTSVHIECIIDKKADKIKSDYKVRTYEQITQELKTDAIVVSVANEFIEIYKKLKSVTDVPVIYIGEILEEI